MNSPESKGVNPLEFPVEYFDAQVHFAYKWSDISGEDLASVLETKTVLYRRFTGSAAATEEGNSDWDTLLADIDPSMGPDEITKVVYGAFAERPDSLHQPGKHQTALGYDYFEDRDTVKIHFTNPRRGEKPLSDENMPKRRNEFRALLENVREEHPEAAMLMSATWLRSTSHYRDLSPPDIAPQKDLMSPDMKFTGNSIWGQFLDASGNVNQRIYEQFMNSVEAAETVEDLVDAFPYRTQMALDPIDMYYEYYGMNGAEVATIDDLDDITDLMEVVYADTYPNDRGITRDMFENNKVFREHLQEYLAKRLTNPDKKLLIAKQAGKVVGTIGLGFNEEKTGALIWGFYVHPDVQASGVGRQLWGELMSDERLDDVDMLYLDVAKDSVRAKDFYEKNGFEVVGEEDWDWPYWTDERPHNQYWLMEKKLR